MAENRGEGRLPSVAEVEIVEIGGENGLDVLWLASRDGWLSISQEASNDQDISTYHSSP